MLGYLTEKMHSLASKLAGKKTLTEENVREAVRDVRMALLEADVQYEVVKALVQKVKERALGDEVMKNVTAGQQFVKIVHDELVSLMGGEEFVLEIRSKPVVILLCGLQGSGKTTTAAKLAKYLKRSRKAQTIHLIACDLQRPAAIDQLEVLGNQVDAVVYADRSEKNAALVAKRGLEKAVHAEADVVIVDTAGRLHVDSGLMEELKAVGKAVSPNYTFFVANATTGQEAVEIAKQFDATFPLTGSILTMLDGNTRGGAAISIRESTGKPLVFEGVGEKIDDLRPFNPSSMADRILGMGDTVNLVRKAEEHFSKEDAKELEQKLLTASFTYEDYLKQIHMVKKMGSLKGLLNMLPGGFKLKELDIDDRQLARIEAVIYSMTPKERAGIDVLSLPRRRRIAKGSGRSVDEVSRLEGSFKQAKKFFKNMPNVKQLEKMFGGTPWH
jgi:signal recognition particle subunit SRP54